MNEHNTPHIDKFPHDDSEILETEELNDLSDIVNDADAISVGDTNDQSREELEKLLDLAKEVFSGVSDKMRNIADAHIEREAEEAARKNGRGVPLGTLKTALKLVMDQEYVAEDSRGHLQELEESARDGNRDVHAGTEYMYDPNSAFNQAAHINSDKAMLEAKAHEYVARDDATHHDVPEKFIDGLKALSAANDVLNRLGTSLESFFRADADVKDAFYALRIKLMNFPREYDEDAAVSTLRTLNDLIAATQDSDKKRTVVSQIAIELQQVADSLTEATQ